MSSNTMNDFFLEGFHFERQSQAFYEAMLSRVEFPPLRRLLKDLVSEEKSHAEAFLRRAGISPSQAKSFQEEACEGVLYSAGLTIPTLFEIAIEREEKAYEMYKNKAREVDDEGLWVFLMQMADIERTHKARLLRELRRYQEEGEDSCGDPGLQRSSDLQAP